MNAPNKKDKLIASLDLISKLMLSNKINWSLIGSANMFFQGIDVNPNDLDVVVHLNDLKSARNIFKDYNPSEIKELKPLVKTPAWEFKFNLFEITIQFLGENDGGDYVKNLLSPDKIKNLQIENLKIPCFKLETEMQVYSDTKRFNKSNLIKSFLENSK